MADMSRRWDHQTRRKSRSGAKTDPFWRRHEKTSAERTGGRDQPRPNKSDGTSFGTRFQRECKSTTGFSIGVNKQWLEKLDQEAALSGRKPVLVLGFESMRPGVERQWACVPLSLLRELVEGQA
jgi:hypothetical protein